MITLHQAPIFQNNNTITIMFETIQIKQSLNIMQIFRF